MSTDLILRRSAAESARACLFRFNKIWRQNTPDTSDPSLRGIGFHLCASKYISRLHAAQLETDEEEARLAFQEGVAEALTPPHLVAEVRDLFFRWARSFSLDLAHYVVSEERQMGRDGSTWTPDLIYALPTGLVIFDWKTYYHELTQEQVKQDWQVRWYLVAASKLFPNFPNYTFVMSFVRFGTQVSVDFEPSDLDDFAQEAGAIAATVREAEARDEWPATPGDHCRFCNLQCPVVDHPAVIPARLITRDQAEKAGALILAGEALLKNAKKALKAYAAANGAVEVNGMVFDNRPQLQRTYPVDQVVKALEKWQKAGALSPEEGLTVSHSSLAKVFRKYPEMEQALSPFVQAKTTYRFSARKPGVGDDEEE